MKRSSFIIPILFFLLACQVVEKSEESAVISGHRSFPNAFTVNAPANGTYYTGDALVISLSFPVAVNVNTIIGLPQLVLDIGGVQVAAQYVSGEGTTSLKFEYIATSADLDIDGFDILFLDLNGALLTFSANGETKTCSSNIPTRHFSAVLIN